MSVEAWLSGPVDGVAPLLLPIAHALLQAGTDVHGAVGPLTAEQIWQKPGAAAPIGYHLNHLAGTLHRLMTYRHARALTDEQLAQRKKEGNPGSPADDALVLLGRVDSAIAMVLDDLRQTREEELLDPREVGRQKLPSTVLGLLFHAAEHTQRHVGQIVTTSLIIRSGAI